MTHPNPPSDQSHILDGLLDELFDRQTPTTPSLESLLRQVANNESNNIKRFTSQEIEQALFAAQQDSSHKTATKTLHPKSQRNRSPWILWASIAAALLAVSLVLWRDQVSQIPQASPSETGLASKLELPSHEITNTPENHRQTNLTASGSPGPKNATVELGNTDQRKVDQTKDALKIASVPSESQNHPQAPPLSNTLPNNRALQNNAASQNQSVYPSENRLGTESDRNIIAVIDHQFEDMWKPLPDQKASVRIQASPNTIDRMAQYLLARPANPTELEALRQADLLGTKEASKLNAEWIDAVTGRWLNSEEFARQWAKRLSNFYRGEYPIRNGQLEQAKTFELWLAGRIHEDTPLNVIQAEVLQGLWAAEHPARFLVDHWAELSTRSGSATHRINDPVVGRAPSSPQTWVELTERQHATLTGLTHLFLRITDNTNLACVQCHQKSGELTGRPMPAPANVKTSGIHTTQDLMFENSLYAGEQFVRNDRTAKPIAFGSIAALLVGVIEPERKELFTRDAEDRLIKLLPVNPEGVRISEHQSGADAMADWAERGSHSHRGPINALWKSFFGVHLVRPSERFAISQSSSREDLLEFLSQRSSAQKASLRQLAYWMLHSAPSRQPNVSLIASDLQTLDTDTLRDIANQVELQFLQIPSQGTSPFTQDFDQQIQAKALRSFVSQTVPPPQELQQRAILAQPITQPTIQNSAQAPMARQPSAVLSPALTELFIACPPKELTLLESHWSKNTLTQPALIEHAYLTLRGRLPSNLENETWNQSNLELYDRADAIRRLTSAVANFEYADATN